MVAQEAHEILGVAPDASCADVRRAFLAEAKRWHPDKRPLGECEADAAAARARFVEVHSAYEAISFAAAPASTPRGTKKQPDPIGNPAAVKRASEALEVARGRRAEAEEHLGHLREVAKATRWSQEQSQVFSASARRAFRAVERLRQEEVAAEFTLKMEEACCGHASLAGKEKAEPHDLGAPEKQPELDGPRRQNLDHLQEAFVELAFDFWASVTPLWGGPSPAEEPVAA